MATTHGNDGIARLGANAIAETTSWSVAEAQAVADDTAQGDAADTHKTGTYSWNGTVNCWWDDTDTNGQVAMTIGASVSLELYPRGTESGKPKWSGTATITGINSTSDRAQINSASFNFTGNGALTKGTA